MIIAIEGMDGVGKTTISKMISKELGYKFIDKPIKYMKGYETEIEEVDNKVLENIYQKNTLIRSLYFLTGNILALDVANINEDVVIDRHFASNLFWNATAKEKELFKEVISLSEEYYPNNTTKTFFLYADKEVIKQRLYSRNEKDEDIENVDELIANYYKMKELYTDLKQEYYEIDTTNLTIKEVADIIIEKVKEEK